MTDIPVTAHKFRHTYARTWLERGGEVIASLGLWATVASR